MNLPLNKGKVLSCLEKVLSNIAGIKVITAISDELRVCNFLKDGYQPLFPAIHVNEAVINTDTSVCLYTEDEVGVITSTASISWLNGEIVPEVWMEEVALNNKNNDVTLQVGRFYIRGMKEQSLLKLYFKCFVELANTLGVSTITGLVKGKDLRLHEVRFKADVLVRNTDLKFGSEHEFALVQWRFNSLDSCFYHWLGVVQHTNPGTFTAQDWNDYARSFASVQTQVQQELQQEAVRYLNGNVGDFGCGCAKIGLILSDSERVRSYIGIDASIEMINIAQVLLEDIEPINEQSVHHGFIEDYNGSPFDTGVSLNSYYSWPNPLATLKHIYSLIEVGGTFILATPNKSLDLILLEKQAKKELIAHPDYKKFREHNLKLINDKDANLVEMSELITQVQSVGFKIEACHQEYYCGGLNFLVLSK
ncbi:methyltransferase domain-containing protein [Pseudoalteromonas sp. SWXJZ94C]|uniref:class I SAM-dependent methyltransferase n=1 Tax=Pseudoalteromonas sp. SWXJZ94C TaxID=2792065 RepID=UPI0018CFA33A|nr:methyltransferase domain-containing protein [Pseudoalteromonas sp. SWXJZ94C]MBH0058084.1 methyltransferase domain-containing protein [Pseudoalteromonas sp. SWXJZ94C]